MSKIGHFFHHLGHEIKSGFHHVEHDIDKGFHHLGHDIKSGWHHVEHGLESGWHHVEHGLDKGLHELVHQLKDPLFDVGLLCDALGFVVGPEMEVVGGALMAGRTAAKAGRAAAKAVDAGRAIKNAGTVTKKTAKTAGKVVDHVKDAKDKIEEIKDKINAKEGVKNPSLLSNNLSPTGENPAEIEKIQKLLMMMQLMACFPGLMMSANAFNGESTNFSTSPMPLDMKMPEEGIETSQSCENLTGGLFNVPMKC